MDMVLFSGYRLSERVFCVKSSRYAIVAAMIILAPSYGGEMKTLAFPGDVQTRDISDRDAVRAYLPPKQIRFALRDNPIIDGDKLVIVAELINDGKDFALVVRPYGGGLPYGGTSPFSLAFSQTNTIDINYVGRLVPAEPPLPMEILVPEKSIVLFRGEIPLDLYQWEGAPEVSVDWSFYYFRDPYPKGTVKVVLPKTDDVGKIK